MSTELPLSGIQPGNTAKILDICGDRDYARRLMELGIAPGGKVRCLFRSANGDPTAYQVSGTVIALRRVDASGIQVVIQ